MRLVLLSLLGAVLLLACGASPDPDPSPIPGVAIEGRYANVVDGERTHVVLGYPGARLVMNAPGTVTLDIDSRGTLGALDVRVDDGPWKRIDLEEGEQMLSLGPGSPHRLEIVRRNEDWQGPLHIRGVTSEAGPLGRTPALPERKILFIGDSITAGAGTDVAYEDAGLGKPLDNGRLAFPRVLAERLNAQVHQLAYGGRGIIRDWRGYPTGRDGVLNAPALYDLASPGEEQVWDASQWVPDAVVIGLGTNDFNPGIPDRAYFVDSYVDFIRRIQADAPGAPILILGSPMTDGEKGAALSRYLDRVAERAGKGVHRLDTRIYKGRESVVGHPTDAQHIAIADEIEPVLRQLLD